MDSIHQLDSQYVWHPYSQEKIDSTIPIIKGEGSYLIAEDGSRYLDAISSWWVNLHGHCHPEIALAIKKQVDQLEHCIFAGFTHQWATQISKELSNVLPGTKDLRMFFSDNGSTAIEVAIKCALQYFYNQKIPRKRIISLKGAYHGDTSGAMSVGSRSKFSDPFEPLLAEVDFIDCPIPGSEEKSFKQLKELLEGEKHACFIFEPLVQGTAGMIMYSPDILDKMIELCHQHNTLCIADEVFTGFGRTGKWFATSYLKNEVDLTCLSKGLTGGFMPLGITACQPFLYQAFYDNDRSKTFFHGHSYTGNPLACAAALASMNIMKEDKTWFKISMIEKNHQKFKERIKSNSKINDIRILGTIIAIELKVKEGSYFNPIRDEIYNFFLSKKMILRPLGNIIYLVPPYSIEEEELEGVYKAIIEFISN